jgi:hypothetical protein
MVEVDPERVLVALLLGVELLELPSPPLEVGVVLQLGQVTTKFQLVPPEFTKLYE